MTGLIQGTDAVLSFYKDDYIPFVCATDISLSLTAGKLPVRTAKDGYWKKFTYQDLSYTLTLSGLLKFDVANWTGWDMFDNQLGFSQVQFQCTFRDDQGNVRSIRGQALVETNTVTITVSALVKQDLSLQGSGKMIIFDGIVPCATAITAITFTGLADPDGNVTVNYTYTGDAYQVKYLVDGTGDYIYALPNGSISLPSSAIGDHSIEIIPVCQNGFEGTGMIQEYTVTHDTACPAVITDISISGTYIATNTHTGPASIMRYKIDGAPMWSIVPINTPIPLGGLSAGAHTIKEQPGCTIGLWGTSFTKAFTIASQPAQSQIKYSTAFDSHSDGTFNIYVNGVLTVTLTDTQAETSINVPTGASVRVALTAGGGRTYDLKTVDESTATTLDEQSGTFSLTATYQYTFTATAGHTYNLTGTLQDL
jgi:hypothetical protein